MTHAELFEANVRRIRKYDRSEHAGVYNAARVCTKIMAAFEKENPDLRALFRAAAEYWHEKYIAPSEEFDNEPTDAHVRWLSDAIELFDGKNPENCVFTDEDWRNVCELVNYEASDIPLELLSAMMTVFLDRNAVR